MKCDIVKLCGLKDLNNEHRLKHSPLHFLSSPKPNLNLITKYLVSYLSRYLEINQQELLCSQKRQMITF